MTKPSHYVNNKDFQEFIIKYGFEPEQKLKVSLKQLYNEESIEFTYKYKHYCNRICNLHPCSNTPLS